MYKKPQFWAQKNSNWKDCKYPFNNVGSLKFPSEFCENPEDPFIEKLVKKIEQRNRFRNIFDVESY